MPSVTILSGYHGHLSPLYQNVLIYLCLKELGCITPLVLLPSERLSGLEWEPIIVLLWLMILRQVPGRTRAGSVCLRAGLRRRIGEMDSRICESA